MSRNHHFSQSLRFIIGMAALGITLFAIASFSSFLNTVIVAALLAILFTPLVTWLQKRGSPRWLALILTLLMVIAVMIGLALFLLLSASQFAAAIPTYAMELEAITVDVREFLASRGLDSSETESLFELIDPEELVGAVGQLFASLFAVLADGVTVLLILAFLLFGSSSFAATAKRLMKEGNPGLQRLFAFNQDVRSYIVITNNAGLAVAVVNTILLLIIGVDFAILWGVLSWIMSFVPYVGFVLAVIPPFVLALLEFGWPAAILILAAYIVINSAMDDVIKPRMMSKGLNLAPVIVFISVVFWGLILGPLGGILAVPVTLGIKELVLESDPDNRWIAELIGSGESDDLEEHDADN